MIKRDQFVDRLYYNIVRNYLPSSGSFYDQLLKEAHNQLYTQIRDQLRYQVFDRIESMQQGNINE